MEGRNTGVPLIVSSMKNNGSGLPVFETDEDRSYFLTVLPIHPYFIKGPGTHANEQPEKDSSRRSRNELHSLIIELLNTQGNLSTNEIASALGYKRRTNTLRAVISEMLETGEVAYLYPDKPNSRNQKICLAKARE